MAVGACLDVSMVRAGVCGGGVGDCRTGVRSIVIVAIFANGLAAIPKHVSCPASQSVERTGVLWT